MTVAEVAAGVEACSCAEFTSVADLYANGTKTLVESLTPTVDAIRDLKTRLGARVYQVTLVWTRWLGGKRGVGIETVVDTHPILPTPACDDLTNLQAVLNPIGVTEVGELRISEISPRYTEELLSGRDVVVPLGAELPPDVSFYWEISAPKRDGTWVRRRFVLVAAPSKDALKFEWVVRLTRAAKDRVRAGELDLVPRRGGVVQ